MYRVQDTCTEYRIHVQSTGYMYTHDTGTELRIQSTGHTGTDNRIQNTNAKYYNITKKGHTGRGQYTVT